MILSSGVTFSTQGHKRLVLEGVASYFNDLDNACRKEDKEDKLVIKILTIYLML